MKIIVVFYSTYGHIHRLAEDQGKRVAEITSKLVAR